MVSKSWWPTERAPLRRETVHDDFSTGIRAIDGLLSIGAGQRVALLADPEAGRTELLTRVARRGGADANLVLLLGTNPQELRHIVETGLGPEAMARTILVAVLAGEPPAHLARAATLACQIAHGLGEQRQNVLLAVDSLSHLGSTGWAGACSALIACAGNRGHAAVTGFYALDAAGENEPLWPRFDALIRLRRDLAERGYGPPIDFLQSWRRGAVPATPGHQQAAKVIIQLLAAYEAIEERLNTAAYRTGRSYESDLALKTRQAVLRYLQQSPDEPCDLQCARTQLMALMQEIEATAARLTGSFYPAREDQARRLRPVHDLDVRALAG